MKIRRYKKVAKNLNFYMHNFNFRQPYQMLIDGTFCFVALNNKINIEDNIPRYLQGDVKFLTTQCVYIETENLGKKVFGALLILKKFAIHKCGHEGKPIAGAKCLLSMIGASNKDHYIIATQDLDLQNKVRQIPGVPLLYLHQKTPVFEQPSEASVKYANKTIGLGEYEKETIANLKAKHGIIEEEEQPKRKKKKGGPNPLSCKKKKRKVDGTQVNNITKKKETNPEVEKKRRKKIRIPQHIKEELIKSVNKE